MILNSLVLKNDYCLICSNNKGYYVSMSRNVKQFNIVDYVNAEQTAKDYYIECEIKIINKSKNWKK